MALTVQGGWLDGSPIRKARKEYRCEYWRGKSSGGFCFKPLAVGAYYVEGEITDSCSCVTRNGVFIRDKYCLECAGIEAIASVALVGA